MRLFFKIQNEFIIVFEYLFYFFWIGSLLYHPAPFGNDISQSTPEICRVYGDRRHFIYIPDYPYAPQVWDE